MNDHRKQWRPPSRMLLRSSGLTKTLVIIRNLWNVSPIVAFLTKVAPLNVILYWRSWKIQCAGQSCCLFTVANSLLRNTANSSCCTDLIQLVITGMICESEKQSLLKFRCRIAWIKIIFSCVSYHLHTATIIVTIEMLNDGSYRYGSPNSDHWTSLNIKLHNALGGD